MGFCGHAHFEKRTCKPSLKRWNFTHEEQQTQQNKCTRLGLKNHCWVAFNYAPSFYKWIFTLKWIVYAAFRGLIWLLQALRKLLDHTTWTTQNFKGLFLCLVQSTDTEKTLKSSGKCYIYGKLLHHSNKVSLRFLLRNTLHQAFFTGYQEGNIIDNHS